MSNRRIREKKENKRDFTPEEVEQIERDYVAALESNDRRWILFWTEVEKYAKKSHKREKASSVLAMLKRDLDKVV